MILGRSALAMLLMTSVVELRFRRRIEKAGYGSYRRMLCSNDRGLLMSTLGREILNFEPATQPPKYDPVQKNLIITWDIFYKIIDVLTAIV